MTPGSGLHSSGPVYVCMIPRVRSILSESDESNSNSVVNIHSGSRLSVLELINCMYLADLTTRKRNTPSSMAYFQEMGQQQQQQTQRNKLKPPRCRGVSNEPGPVA